MSNTLPSNPPQSPPPEPASQPTAEASSPPSAKTPTTAPLPPPSSDPSCGICHAAPPKYKCPTCRVPYCSLTCYTPHRASHSSEQSHNVSTNTSSSLHLESQNNQPPPPHPPPTSEPSNSLSPQIFSSLLKTYPSLATTLSTIHAATLEPPSSFDPHDHHNPHPFPTRGAYRSRGRGRGRTRGYESTPRKWTPEHGERKGLDALRRAKASTADAEGMRVFSESVREGTLVVR